jgi:hypothetical protein
MIKATLSGCMALLCAFSEASIAFKVPEEQKYTISGKIKGARDGEDLIGATVQVKGQSIGTVTNVYGFYSLTLPQGSYTLTVSYIGYTTVEKYVLLTAHSTLNFELDEEAQSMQEVVISAEKADANVTEMKMSTIQLKMDQVKQLPPLFGEPDVIKVVQMQPGVLSAGEGTSSFFVRGGAADQNMILIDEAPIYDASHLFGLFSVFNADIIKSAELYKGGIPAQFGGRLSSIMDVRVKDGNSRKLSGSAAVGLLAAKVSLEGPLLRDKASFILAARRSYAGYYLRFAPDEEQRENNVYFYDYNAKMNFTLSEKSRLFVSAYLGRDVFKFGNDFRMDWGNATTTLRWNYIFNKRLFVNTTGIFSNFDYALTLSDDVMGFKWTSTIREYTIKQDYNYYLNPSNTISFGFFSSYKTYEPGMFVPKGVNSIFSSSKMEALNGLDQAVYISNKQDITERLGLEYGVRMSVFSNVGPQTVYKYKDPADIRNVVRMDSTVYGKGAFVKTYVNPEPRLSMRYVLNEQSSVKASFNRMAQNAHQMITGTTPLPVSIWLPSNSYVKPQIADQVAAGYFRNFYGNRFETSAEVYYKKMKNVLDFADNANVFFNPDIATVLRPGTSDSYGLEYLVRKTSGPLQGWLSYTWSKTTRSIPGVNQNTTFPASYDRRHAFSLAATYTLSSRWSFGGNWVYSTGRPITVPSGKYQYRHYLVDEYTSRNGYRLPDFHRLDLSATLKSKTIPNRKWSSELNISLYNVYNRKNPFTVFTRAKQDSNGNTIEGTTEKEAVMIYLFPVLPSVSYSIHF